MSHQLWEILVPCNWNTGKPIRRRHHEAWDVLVRAVAGGLTILRPGKGQWLHEGKLYNDRVIPVRIMATGDEMRTISQLTLNHYRQLAVMYYLVSEECMVTLATAEQVERFKEIEGAN